MSATTRTRRLPACDRCHALKEKCMYSAGSLSCGRCVRLRRDCFRNRKTSKPGPKPLASAEAAITFDPDASDRLTSQWNVLATLLPLHPLSDTDSGVPTDLVNDAAIFSSPHFQTLAATFIPPMVPDLGIPLVPSLPVQMSIASKPMKPVEQALLVRMLDKSNFADHMVLGPSLADTLQRTIYSSLAYYFDQVKDCFLACYGSLTVVHGLHLEGVDAQENLRRGRLAVSKIHAHRDNIKDNLPIWIILGTSVVTFDLCAHGTGGSHVRRFVLKQIASYPETIPRCGSLSELNCLIIFDINDCLFRREAPILRPAKPDLGFVDSYIGLCCSLTPYMFDACSLSHSLHHAAEEDRNEIMQALETLDDTIQSWQPDIPVDFTSRYKTDEVIHMLAQVRVYRTALSLFIHRLKHPFGSEDRAADRMAQNIFTELELARSTTNRGPRCITIPLMLAGIEMCGEDRRQRFLESVDIFVGHTFPLLRKQLKPFFKALWDTRDYSVGLSWLDLVPHLPSVTVAI